MRPFSGLQIGELIFRARARAITNQTHAMPSVGLDASRSRAAPRREQHRQPTRPVRRGSLQRYRVASHFAMLSNSRR